MDYEAIRDALDGFAAYDAGAVDSGIRDKVLEERVFKHIVGLEEAEERLLISRVVRDLFLSEEALGRGYGYEDATDFLRWYDGEYSLYAEILR